MGLNKSGAKINLWLICLTEATNSLCPRGAFYSLTRHRPHPFLLRYTPPTLCLSPSTSWCLTKLLPPHNTATSTQPSFFFVCVFFSTKYQRRTFRAHGASLFSPLFAAQWKFQRKAGKQAPVAGRAACVPKKQSNNRVVTSLHTGNTTLYSPKSTWILCPVIQQSRESKTQSDPVRPSQTQFPCSLQIPINNLQALLQLDGNSAVTFPSWVQLVLVAPT